MTLKAVSDLQQYRVGNTYNAKGKNYASSEGLLDLDEMLADWVVDLRGRLLSQHTQRIYRSAVQSFLDFCDACELPRELSKPNVIAYLASWGGEASTAVLHLRVLKIFARWLQAEEGYDAAGVVSVKTPKADQPAVPDLQEDEIRRMLRACEGASLRDRRDKAMLALLAETGMRAGELVALDVPDVDVAGCVAHIRRGKGGKGRKVRFSPATAALIARYLRSRRQADQPAREGHLWVSMYGARLGYMGVVRALKGRAEDAGVEGFHLHRLRHTAAVRWMQQGGSQVGLMAQAGWSSPTMVARYVKAASERLAAAEFDRLGLGIAD